MKFSPYNWNEVKSNETLNVEKGRVRLQISKPSAIFTISEGYEALVGYGTSFDFEISESAQIKIDGPTTARLFHYRSAATTLQEHGEVFTNIDRMVQESGTMAEVTRALRMLEIERRSALRDIQRASNGLSAQRRAAQPNPAPEPEPTPEPSPAPEPAST